MAKKYKRCKGYPLIEEINHTEYMKAYRSQNPGKKLREIGKLDEKEFKKMSRVMGYLWIAYFSWFIFV